MGVGNFLVSPHAGIVYSGISERNFKAKHPTKLTSERKEMLKSENALRFGTELVSFVLRTEGINNMKTVLLGALLIVISYTANAYISGIAIQTDKSSNMQVYVNGKLFNKQPGNFVRIKSKPGLFHVKVKVLNPYDNVYYVVNKDIRVEKGYEFFYKMIFEKGKRPRIQEIRRYPVYSKYFLNPILYNRHPTA